jgi:hypothetical protein
VSALRDRVQERHASIPVGGNHGVADAGERRAEEFLLLEQRVSGRAWERMLRC